MDGNKLTRVVIANLDEGKPASSLARDAHHSRSHFFRLFRSLHDEPPAAMRRRLLLERAAWCLTHTRRPVTEIALDANYNSLEAFTRAFKKAFRISPSLYRRLAPVHYQLPAPGGIHYFSPKGNQTMDLFDLFAGTDAYHTQRLLEHALPLTDEQLDRAIPTPVQVTPWEQPERSLRELLERLVFTKEVWVAALSGGTMPEAPVAPCPAPKLLERFLQADGAFRQILSGVRNRDAWGDTFVDALCEPPETFTFGGVFAHVITFNTYRRLTALDALRRLGVAIEGFGCPSEFLQPPPTATES